MAVASLFAKSVSFAYIEAFVMEGCLGIDRLRQDFVSLSCSHFVLSLHFCFMEAYQVVFVYP